MNSWQEGDRVIYVPGHANHDPKHKDCEHGVVKSVNAAGTVFVRFDGKTMNEPCTATDLWSEELG